MVLYTPRLEADIARFRERVLSDPTAVLDPEDLHHEFVSGNHGRKLDFDKIETGSDFFIDWIAIYARAVRERYANRLPDAVVGVANGANRLALAIAPLLGEGVLALTTEKLDPKTVQLDDDSRAQVYDNDVRFALVVEDVGTTGSTAATAITDLRGMDVRRIEAINGWQRNNALPKLEELRIPYGAVILDPLPMFSPEACVAEPDGYCAQGVELVKHD